MGKNWQREDKEREKSWQDNVGMGNAVKIDNSTLTPHKIDRNLTHTGQKQSKYRKRRDGAYQYSMTHLTPPNRLKKGMAPKKVAAR